MPALLHLVSLLTWCLRRADLIHLASQLPRLNHPLLLFLLLFLCTELDLVFLSFSGEVTHSMAILSS